MAQGLMVVIGAPSGTGKSTIVRRVMSEDPRVCFSVSHTTRPPRAGEEDGVAYHFVTPDAFAELAEAGGFAEHATVHGRSYGTSHAEIRRLWAAGRDVLFDIDVQGEEQLTRAYPDLVRIFIMPPSMDELERRLRGRATDSDDQIAIRLTNAVGELRQAERYDYVIVNDDLDRAVSDFHAILHAERCRRPRVPALVDLLASLPHA